MELSQVFVQDIQGKTHVMPLSLALTGKQVRAKIANELKLPDKDLRLLVNKKQLQDETCLQEDGVASGSLIKLLCRLRGGGGDGGCHMVRRDCLLWVKGPAEKKKKYDKTTLSRILWTTCKKSNERLRHPIVACELGFMYNKEAMLLALLDKDNSENEDIQHVRKLSDLTQLILEKNPAWKEAAAGSESMEELIDQFVCPVVHDVTSNGVHRFVFYKQCGHVVSQDAVKTIGNTECLVCHKQACTMEAYDGTCENIILPLCPTDEEELQQLQEFAHKRRTLRKAQDSKAKRKAKEVGSSQSGGENKAAAKEPDSPKAKKQKGAYIVGVPKGLTLPSHENVPATATPEVWKSLFQDPKAKKPKDDGFLTRAGMFGGGGGRNI